MNKELKLSFEILSAVILDKSYVSIELNKALDKNSKDINTSLVTKIVYGVLEKDIMLNYYVSGFFSKQPKPKILILLKIVAYVSMEINSIPTYALVSEIVDLSKTVDLHVSGFVNSVSKKIVSGKIVYPSTDNKVKYLSVKYNYPEWVIVELLKKFDEKFVTDLVSHELSTLTHIRILTSKISVVEFKKILSDLGILYKNSEYDYTLYVQYSKVLNVEALKGKYVVQGLPSIITCNAIGASSGNLLDVCAAPGGKSVYIAENPKLSVYSCDIHKHRVELIKSYAKSAGVNLKTIVNDATKLNNDWIEKFDYVLCDVPCSNLGVSRKKPDVFLNKSIEDVKTLSGIQLKILETSANYVKHGGVLQYSTCTILDRENRDVILKFLKTHKDFKLTTIDVGNLKIVNENNMYTFYPNLTDTEGFFIGRMIRI